MHVSKSITFISHLSINYTLHNKSMQKCTFSQGTARQLARFWNRAFIICMTQHKLLYEENAPFLESGMSLSVIKNGFFVV